MRALTFRSAKDAPEFFEETDLNAGAVLLARHLHDRISQRSRADLAGFERFYEVKGECLAYGAISGVIAGGVDVPALEGSEPVVNFLVQGPVRTMLS